jgi:hypothetical protein
MSKSCRKHQKVVKKLSKSCQQNVKECSKSCQKVVKKLSKSCQKVEKKLKICQMPKFAKYQKFKKDQQQQTDDMELFYPRQVIIKNTNFNLTL